MTRPGLRKLHLLSAMVLGLFLLLHIANHIAGLWGIESHIAFMDRARTIYRQPLLEMILIGLVGFQALSGITMLLKGWRSRTGLLPWVQALSGAYLAFFLLVHVSAVLTGRLTLGLDTNFYFAAAGFHVAGWVWFFTPYYFLAVAALFTHIGCALFWNIDGGGTIRSKTALMVSVTLGLVLGTAITAALAGKIYPVAIPQRYLNTYLQ